MANKHGALDVFLDYDGSIVGVPNLVAKAQGLGKIFVRNGRWHLPMINASLGADQDNVTMLSGTTDVHLRSGGIALNSTDTLLEMGKVAAFDAKVNSLGELVFARISADITDAGALTIFRYTLSAGDWVITNVSGGSATDRNELDILGSFSFQSVKLAVDATSNPFYYVIAQEKAVNGGEWHIGRYDYILDSGVPSREYFLTAKLSTTDLTGDVITDTRMINPELVSIPGFSEARLFFHSVGTGVTSYPRMARWKSDDTISCGICFSLSGTVPYRPTAKVGVSQIANNLPFGTAGAIVNENVRDTVFVLFSSDTTSTSVYKPQLGIINVETEAIQSTAVEPSGLYRPPFSSDL